jgi:hypothetical protein
MELCNKAKSNDQSVIRRPSKRSVYRWIIKNAKVKLKRPNSMDKGRIAASTVENIQQFFTVYENDLKELHYKPDLIVLFYFYILLLLFFFIKYNFDESASMVKKPFSKKFVVPNNTESIFEPTPNAISGISICPCISADGEHLPTAIIFDSKFDFEIINGYKCNNFKFEYVELEGCHLM